MDDESAINRKIVEVAHAFGSLVRSRRKTMRMRQDQLALATGVGRRFVIDLEAGTSASYDAAYWWPRPLGLIWTSLHLTPVPRPPRNCLILPKRRSRMAVYPYTLSSGALGRLISIRMARASYHPGWVGLKGAFPISITMPLGSERIASDTFLPWAANLLPESVQLRTLGQLLGMARGDVAVFSPQLAATPRGRFQLVSLGEPLRFTGTRLSTERP